MSFSDPIADMLTRIRNAGNARLPKVEIPFSKMKMRLLEILRDEGYLRTFKVVESTTGHGMIKVYMKYDDKNRSVINGIHRNSRPGLRSYIGYRDLSHYKNGFGISILTTSRGVMTDQQARDQKVGGELLCSVW